MRRILPIVVLVALLTGCKFEKRVTYTPGDGVSNAASAILIVTPPVTIAGGTAVNFDGNGNIAGTVVANTVSFNFSGGTPTPFAVGPGRRITFTVNGAGSSAAYVLCWYAGAAPAVPATGIATLACPGTNIAVAAAEIAEEKIYAVEMSGSSPGTVAIAVNNTGSASVPYVNLAVYSGAPASQYTDSTFASGLTSGTSVGLVVPVSSAFPAGITVVSAPFTASQSPATYDGALFSFGSSSGDTVAFAALGQAPAPAMPPWAQASLALALTAIAMAFAGMRGSRRGRVERIS
jgi:hypothetical protein